MVSVVQATKKYLYLKSPPPLTFLSKLNKQEHTTRNGCVLELEKNNKVTQSGCTVTDWPRVRTLDHQKCQRTNQNVYHETKLVGILHADNRNCEPQLASYRLLRRFRSYSIFHPRSLKNLLFFAHRGLQIGVFIPPSSGIVNWKCTPYKKLLILLWITLPYMCLLATEYYCDG